MNVFYDGHIFRWANPGGIRRYFWELITHLPPDWIPVVLGSDSSCPLPSHPGLRGRPRTALRPGRLTQAAQLAWWRRCELPRAQVFHPTYYHLTGKLEFPDIRCPIVITFHDLIAARHPTLEPFSDQTIRAQRESIDSAARIICVSRHTEKDLLELFPAAAGKTTVIHHGTSFVPGDTDTPVDVSARPYFLYVGSRSTYKNFPFLLQAFARASSVNARLRLQIAGPPLNPDEKWMIHFMGLAANVDAIALPDEAALQKLYRGSLGLLYPSRYEGFGLPPLEAMACGTIPIASNATSLPEVLGDAGILLDPTDASAWAEAMLAVAGNMLDRPALLARGKRRAAELTWAASAAKHAALYRQLA